jgi:hypothetical protein
MKIPQHGTYTFHRAENPYKEKEAIFASDLYAEELLQACR